MYWIIYSTSLIVDDNSVIDISTSDSWAPILPNFLVILDADFRVGGKIPSSNNFFILSFKSCPVAFLSLQINSSVFLNFTKHDSESIDFNSKVF